MNDERYYIRKGLELAKEGLGYVSPNPPVGALIVKAGEIIGEGYHQGAGLPHAEIVAIDDALAKGHLLEGATIYITLEPCCTWGRTPPCTDAIIKQKFKKVVFAIKDPNPNVSGRSIDILRAEGIEVEYGFEAEHAEWLIEPFATNMNQHRAFIVLKFASTLDGQIATKTGHAKWISCEKTLDYTHKLRAEYDAILIGSGTLISDNPSLTTRRVTGKNPVRIVIAGKNKLPLDRKIFTDGGARSIVATYHDNPFTGDIPDSVELWRFPEKDGRILIRDIANRAFNEDIYSIMIEGGSSVNTQALSEKIADRIYIDIAPKILGKGIPSIGDLGIEKMYDAIDIVPYRIERIGNDVLFVGRPDYRE